ncbi:uncharacterized protein LOC104001628 isoform X2 [Pan troglodytes]|uniref:uncharacterized protein LOC104001628 isoform X2 n=1 Tax=Pan troglodytes TaxID=9598 RepID=UPI0007DBC4C9
MDTCLHLPPENLSLENSLPPHYPIEILFTISGSGGLTLPTPFSRSGHMIQDWPEFYIKLDSSGMDQHLALLSGPFSCLNLVGDLWLERESEVVERDKVSSFPAGGCGKKPAFTQPVGTEENTN